MSEIKVNSLKGVGASQAAITIDNSSGTCTANITSNGGGQLSNRNLCINGADMMISQRGTSTTGLQNTGGVYTVDRFSHRRYGTWSNAIWKHEQVDSGTGLFKKALKVTCTTAEGSAATGDEAVMIGHYLEAQDTIAAFGDGTAEAKSFTVSFYVKASIATTYVIQMSTQHLTTEKAYFKTFVVNSANTWERKTCTFPAITNSISTVDSTGALQGIRFHWILDAATGSDAVDTFVNFSTNFKYPSGVSGSGFANTLNATFELGGVQIEAGTVATDLEHRSYGQELALSQRYYWRQDSVSNYARYGMISCRSTTLAETIIHLPTVMRAVPTLTTGTVGNSSTFAEGVLHTSTALELDSHSSPIAPTIKVTSSGLVAGQAGTFVSNNTTDFFIAFSAEL